IKAVPSDTAMAAIQGADIVVTTVALMPPPVPFLDARWLDAGSFVTMTDLAQEATMSKPMIRPELVAGDLTGLVSGDVAGRQSTSERTTFAFRGLAVGDLALAGLAYGRAKAIGVLKT